MQMVISDSEDLFDVLHKVNLTMMMKLKWYVEKCSSPRKLIYINRNFVAVSVNSKWKSDESSTIKENQVKNNGLP